jgi:hypothetical protein
LQGHRHRSYRRTIKQAIGLVKNVQAGVGQFVPAVRRHGAPIRITVDGEALDARAGDSILAAVLLRRRALRRHEFGGELRAGFCLMGACQDCWVWLDRERRVRACTTTVTEGMRIDLDAPDEEPASFD